MCCIIFSIRQADERKRNRSLWSIGSKSIHQDFYYYYFKMSKGPILFFLIIRSGFILILQALLGHGDSCRCKAVQQWHCTWRKRREIKQLTVNTGDHKDSTRHGRLDKEKTTLLWWGNNNNNKKTSKTFWGRAWADLIILKSLFWTLQEKSFKLTRKQRGQVKQDQNDSLLLWTRW